MRIGLEDELDIELLTARLQNVQQVLASNAHKTMAARANLAPLEQQLDVVPVVERLLHLRSGDGVPVAHIVHGGIGEHHTPAKGVIGLVALHHRHIMSRVHLLHQQCEVKASGATTYADNFHDSHPLQTR